MSQDAYQINAIVGVNNASGTGPSAVSKQKGLSFSPSFANKESKGDLYLQLSMASAGDITAGIDETKIVTPAALAAAGIVPGGGSGPISHSNLVDLGNDDHEQYMKLDGRGNGQTLIGGVEEEGFLHLQSTNNAVRGFIVAHDNVVVEKSLIVVEDMETSNDLTVNGTLIAASDLSVDGVVNLNNSCTINATNDLILNPAGVVVVSGKKIINCAAPVNSNDVATKQYVDDQSLYISNIVGAEEGMLIIDGRGIEFDARQIYEVGTLGTHNVVVGSVGKQMTVLSDNATLGNATIVGSLYGGNFDNELFPIRATSALANNGTVKIETITEGTDIAGNGAALHVVGGVAIEKNLVLGSSIITDGPGDDVNLVINPKGAGVIDVSASQIVSLAAPTEGSHAVNKNYVDDNALQRQFMHYAFAASALTNYSYSGTSIEGTGIDLFESFIPGIVVGNRVIIYGIDEIIGAYEFTASTENWVLSRIEGPVAGYVYPVLNAKASYLIANATRAESIVPGTDNLNQNGTDPLQLINGKYTLDPALITDLGNTDRTTNIVGDDIFLEAAGTVGINRNSVAGNIFIGGGNSNNQQIHLISGLTGHIHVNDNNGAAETFIGTTSTTGNVMIGNSANKVIVDSIPIADNHVATKGYVDAVAQGLGPKLAVRAKSTAANIATINAGGTIVVSNPNITWTSGTMQFDGVTLSVDDRVLIAHTVAAAYYGIYRVVATSPLQLTRTSDADNSPSTGEVVVGIYTFVQEGAVHSAQGWVLIAFPGSNLGVTNQTWSQVTAAAGGLTDVTVSGSGLSISGTTVKNIAINAENFVNLSASGVVNLSGTSATIKNVVTPVAGGDAVNKTYADTKLAGDGVVNYIPYYSAARTLTNKSIFNYDPSTDALNVFRVSATNFSGTNLTITSNATLANVIVSGGTTIASLAASGIVSLNNNVNGVVNIGTGSNTSDITIGGTGNRIYIKPSATGGEVNIAAFSTGTAVTIGGTGDIRIGNVLGTNARTIMIDTASAGAVLINSGTSGGTTRIGDGALSGSVTIGGNTNNTQQVSIFAGFAFGGAVTISGNAIAIGQSNTSQMTIGSSDSQIIRIKSNITGTGNGFGTLAIGSTLTSLDGGTINIANSALNIDTNIGTSGTTGNITIGSGVNASLVINPPTAGLSLSNKKIKDLAFATLPTDAASKKYADGAGLWKSYVAYRTTDAEGVLILNNSTYTTDTLTASTSVTLASLLGASTIDGQAFSVGQRILVAVTDGSVNSSKQGIYTITQITAPWIFTRTSDYNDATYGTDTTVVGVTIPVRNGTVHGRTFVTVTGGLGLNNAIQYGILSTAASSGGVTISGTTANGAVTVFDTAANTIRVGASTAAKTPTISSEGQLIIPSGNALTSIVYGRSVMSNFANTTSASNVTAFGLNLVDILPFISNVAMTIFGKNILSGNSNISTGGNTIMGYNNCNSITGSVSNCIVVGSNNIKTVGASGMSSGIYIGNDIFSNTGATVDANCVINRLGFDVGAISVTNCAIFGTNASSANSAFSDNILFGNNLFSGTGAATVQNNCIIGANTIAKSTFTPQIVRKTLVGVNNTLTYGNTQSVATTSNLTIIGNSNSFTYNSTTTTDTPELIIGNNNTYIQQSSASILKGNNILIGNGNILNGGTSPDNIDRNIVIGNNIDLNTSIMADTNRSVIIGNNITNANVGTFGSGSIIMYGAGAANNFQGVYSGIMMNSRILGAAVSQGNTMIASSASNLVTNSQFANNVMLNSQVNGANTYTMQNTVVIGTSITLTDSPFNRLYFNTSIEGVSAGSALYISSTGQVGRLVSTRAQKTNIVPIEEYINSTEIIEQLQPCAYNLKKDNSHSIGLIAEDVFTILPDLVPTDENGVPISVRYETLSVVLLAEIKKQKATIDNLISRIIALEGM